MADNSDFFFNDTATTEIYTLSLHDALPIWRPGCLPRPGADPRPHGAGDGVLEPDRKSTRLNSSHVEISYAVFCLKKKKSSPPTLPIPIVILPSHATPCSLPSSLPRC